MNKKIIITISLLFLCIFLCADFIFAKQECTVSVDKPDIGFPIIENGKIPIGEAVDESELLAQNLIIEMKKTIDEIPNMKDSVLALLPLPDLCGCGRTNCNTANLPSYDLCDCQCDGEYECKCDYGLGYDYDYAEEDKYCECNCNIDDLYDYKENCSCSDCNNFTCSYDAEQNKCECANDCECNCTDSTYVCQDSGCECDCEYDADAGECKCDNCTPKNPDFECDCAPKDDLIYTDCSSPPCRNRAIIKECCGLLGCHCNNCYCTRCSGYDVCPSAEIANWVASISNIHSKIDKNFNKIDNLIEAKNLIENDPELIDNPNDPNRWKILNKLIDSREKFEECIIGYESVKKGNKIQQQLFSCDIILREKYVNKVAILGFFQEQENEYPHCYPFTIEVLEDDSKCKQGRTEECFIKIANMELMDNYFCCKGE